MRPLRGLIRIAPALLALAPALGQQPKSLRRLFQEADVALVGVLESSSNEDTTHMHAAKTPTQFGDVYPCQMTIRIKDVIKASGPTLPIAAGAVVQVFSFLPSRDCTPGYEKREALLGRPAFWLLRTEEGALCTVVDNSATVLTLERGLSAEDEGALASLQDPTERAMFLLLKPGLVLSGNEYVRSGLSLAMGDIDDWTTFLTVYRLAFSLSGSYERDLMQLKAAGFGYCLTGAARAARTENKLREWTASLPLLNPDAARASEEAELIRMSWRTKEELLDAFSGSAQAVNDLKYYACSSGVRIKAVARAYLLKYFGIDASALPCIPCD
jgi:hypothetical protein